MRKYINLKKKSNGKNLICNEFSPESLGMYYEKKKITKQRRILDLPGGNWKVYKNVSVSDSFKTYKKKFRLRESGMTNDEMSHNSDEKSLRTAA
jgi:hypothetical protein